jgi:hypothetical protein
MLKLSLLTYLFFITSHSLSDWILAKSKGDISVFTRTRKGEKKLLEFKAVTTMPFSKKQIEKEFVDISNMNKWYDMVSEVKLLKKISNTDAIYSIVFDFPIVSNRYAIVRATLSYDPEGNLVVTSKSTSLPHTPIANCIYTSNLESSWLFSGDDFKLNVEHKGFMDPAGIIPQWLVNSSITDGPIKSIINLKKRLQN